MHEFSLTVFKSVRIVSKSAFYLRLLVRLSVRSCVYISLALDGRNFVNFDTGHFY